MSEISGELGGSQDIAVDGFYLEIQAMNLQPSVEAGFYQHQLADFNRPLLVLSSNFDGSTHAWGSAALIAPGIAITAKHVVEEYRESGRFGEKGVSLLGIGLHESGLNFWAVTQATLMDDTDLVILAMEPRSPIESGEVMGVFPISLLLPEVGDKVIIAGFRSDKIRNEENVVEGAMFSSIGTVTNVYPSGRDRVLQPGPCFEVDAMAVGGMSGGPVFNADGEMIGVLSSSYDLSDGGGIAYISLLWHAMFADITPSWPRHWYGSPSRLADRPNGLFVKGLERLDIVERPDDGKPFIRYRR